MLDERTPTKHLFVTPTARGSERTSDLPDRHLANMFVISGGIGGRVKPLITVTGGPSFGFPAGFSFPV